MSLSFRVSASAKTSPKTALTARLKMVDVLSLDEPGVAVLVRELETDPLFRDLLGMGGGEAVVRRQRFSRAVLSSRFYELNETVAAGADAMDVQGFLSEHRAGAALVRRLGPADFERFFLHQDEVLPREGLASRFALSVEEVDAVFEFVLAFAARAEFFTAPSSAPSDRRFFCVGRIEGDVFDGFQAAYAVPHLARGRYRVNLDAWERRKSGLPPGDRRRGTVLLRRAETLNMRGDAFHRVVTLALEEGRAWLAGGGRGNLRSLSQREAGRRLGLSSSTVSRVVSGRSITAPWNQELRLGDLFPLKKQVLRELLTDGAEALKGLNDREVQAWLKERHQLSVPRRTVNYWRTRLLKEEDRGRA